MSAAMLPAPLAPATPRTAVRADPYADGDGDFEVVKGLRVEKEPVGLIENLIASILHARLSPFCRENNLGWAVSETLFTLPGSGNDRKPDVAFVSFARWPADRPLPWVNAWAVAPDLVVEVISPTDKAVDVIEKVDEYFAGGVRQVWHIYSRVQRVLIFDSPTQVRVLTRGDELTGDPVVPEFRVPVADLFPLAEPRP